MSYFTPALLGELPVPASGLATRILHRDDHLTAVMLAFAAGHELKTHQAPGAATVQILEGRAAFTLGGETREMAAGALVAMAPGAVHAVTALTPMVLLLTWFKAGREAG